MKRTIAGMPVFLIMVIVMVGVLRFLSWVPTALQEGTFRQFPSIEEARRHLQIGHVYTPAYYPNTVDFPPAFIGAQTHPYPAVLSLFRAKGSDKELLVISQTKLPHPPLQKPIVLAMVGERVSYTFKGRRASLEVGACSDGEQCTSIRWEESGNLLSVSMRSSPMELVRIAESMITGGAGTVP